MGVEEHLGDVDPDGMARFIRTGNLIFCTEGYDGSVIMALWDDIGILYERLDADDPRTVPPARPRAVLATEAHRRPGVRRRRER